MKKQRIGFVLMMIISGCLSPGSLSAQNFSEILGRPEDSSITMSILFDEQTDVYWEYGTASGNYSTTTGITAAEKDSCLEVNFTNLTPGTKYFYRTRYRPGGSGTSFSAGTEHTFHTAKSSGSTFTFAIEADPHLDTNSIPAAYALTPQNILSKTPDFMLDLGDNFMSEKLPEITQTEITNRHLLYRSYFGEVCHSVPLFLVPGNHEGELGWQNNGTPDCLPVLAANTRKLYFPNPFPDSFYAGNSIAENYVGLRENYYSWQWRNALFIVLDPYWYTQTKPDWGWTLGKDQYDWFKNTITNSDAKFKFVFCHQLVGGNDNQGRGGTEFAHLWEMGGQNADSTWGFDAHRPGWGKPIHTLMNENNVTVFFHGHDHFFGKQEKDAVVYQEVPQPSCKNITKNQATQYGYVNGVFMANRGYLLVTVTDSTAKIDYIRTFLPNEENGNHHNGEVAYYYTITSSPSAIHEENNETGSSFQLSQNFPNPFKSETSISYKIFRENVVQIKVLDVFGKEIATLVNQHQQPGNYTVSFNSEKLLPAGGICYFNMSAGNDSKTMKMICIK